MLTTHDPRRLRDLNCAADTTDDPEPSVQFAQFWRDRGFTLTAALALALGIGLSTAVFTVAQALLLRDLPVRQQDRLVALWGETPDGSFTNYPLTHDQAREFANRTKTLERSAFFA